MSASRPLPVLAFGLGPIGRAAARLALDRPDLELVAAVDADPALAGEDLGRLLELDRDLGIEVSATPTAANGPAVAIQATGSRLASVERQLQDLVGLGYDVVSSCEELSFPWRRHPDAARRIDEAARNGGRSILGTGVNPGFLMDALPVFLTGLSQRVDRVRVTRVLDASKRRGPFQVKIGAGLTPAAFDAKVREGRLGHVGLGESLDMILASLEWEPERIEETIRPIVAERRIETSHVEVEVGEVAGLEQEVRAHRGSKEVASLRFVAALEAEDPGDTVEIAGAPELSVRLEGTHGDLATVAILVNAVAPVAAARPGLLTMRDMPPLWGTRP